MLDLRPGDGVFVHSDGIVGYLIRRETHSVINHIAMVVDVTCRGPILMDAQPPRVRRAPLSLYRGQIVSAYRPLGLSTEQRGRIVASCLSYEGDVYGFAKIALIALRLQRFCFYDRAPICSYSYAVPFFKEGLTFGKTRAQEATPESIWHFMRAHPDKYLCLRELSLLERC